MGYILIIGANSDIAKAVAREYSSKGYNLYLAARNVENLKTFAQDIGIRKHCDVQLLELDILDYQKHEAFYNSIEKKPVGVISAIGYLGEQEKAQLDFIEAQRIIDTNYTGIVGLFNIIANDFERRKSGFMVGISSVAGDRGRQSNYMYGSAKAAFSTYLAGLRNRLYHANVHVMTVKPGFVRTTMTQGMSLPEKLTATPEEVAKDIFNAQKQQHNILYTKWFWYFIMMIIKMIPEWKFKAMKL